MCSALEQGLVVVLQRSTEIVPVTKPKCQHKFKAGGALRLAQTMRPNVQDQMETIRPIQSD
jgi:hypothetical protein